MVGRQSATLVFAATSDGLLPRARSDARLSIAMGWWTQTQHCHGIVVGRQSATLVFAATSDGLLPRARQMRNSALPWDGGPKLSIAMA